MKKFFREFKEFALKGSVVDMAIGIVIGGAFKNIVTSLVNDIITPFIAMLTGEGSLKALKWTIREATATKAQVDILYGSFLQNIIDFLLVALSIFVAIRVMISAQKRIESLAKKKGEETQDEEVPVIENEIDILKDIRDMMKSEKSKEE